MADSNEYIPPRVWKWEQPSGGQFASINRPVSGATHEQPSGLAAVPGDTAETRRGRAP